MRVLTTRTLTVGLMLCLLALAPVAVAQTAQEIATSVIDELNNVSDYTAAVAINYTDPMIADASGGSLSYKRGATVPKVSMVIGSPYAGYEKSDGDGWNILDKDGNQFYLTQAEGDANIRHCYGIDMFNMERILSTETWARDSGTVTINNVSCYRVFTSKTASNYEVWVDAATLSKVIRVKSTDAANALEWQLDYSDYVLVENTSVLPASILVKCFVNNAVVLEGSYAFSNVSINDTIADSLFEIIKP